MKYFKYIMEKLFCFSILLFLFIFAKICEYIVKFIMFTLALFLIKLDKNEIIETDLIDTKIIEV